MQRQDSPASNHSHTSAVSHISDALNKRISILKDSIKETNSVSGDEKDGPAKHWLVDSLWFQAVVIVMTLMNTAQMGIEADHPEWKQTWQICEIVFTTGFLLEMLSKLMVMKFNYFKDPANCLDCSLVVLGVLDLLLAIALGPGGADLQALSILRILRLARLARILKLVRAFKPLVLVIRGLTSTMSTLGYVFALLMLMIYVAAILLKQSLGESGDTDLYPGYSTDHEVIDEQEIMMNYNPAVYFGSMWLSMITLFNMATFNEWQDVVRPLALRQPAYVLVFLCYAMLVAFGVMNVMTGLIVDSVIAEAKKLEEAHAESVTNERLRKLEKVQKILADMDLDSDGTIDNKELSNAMKSNTTLIELLKSIDLPSAWSADELMHMLDNNGDGALQKSEFTTSFFRLLESSDFQQVCILQASINQAKRMMHTGHEDIRSQLLAMRAELCSIKSAMCPATVSQALSATENIKVSEKVTGEPCQALCQQHNFSQYGKLTNAEKTTNDALTAGICNGLEERIEQISATLMIESLEAAYTVMREAFKEELTSFWPRLETMFTDDKQIAGELIEMSYSDYRAPCWDNFDCTSRTAGISEVPPGKKAQTVLVMKVKKSNNLQSAHVNLAAEGLECTQDAGSFGDGVVQRSTRIAI